MFRFLFLRFLPRRLLPFLMLFEVIRFVRMWRARDAATTTSVTRRP